jgi:glutathione S-transferase
MTTPILYSLRNCPYAIRARLAIFGAQQTVILRDLVLSNKPAEMLAVSPKGTVPVLVLAPREIVGHKQVELKPVELKPVELKVIEQSLDIMLWALGETDPDNLLQKNDADALPKMLKLIATFDDEFKTSLEQYKCAKRYHEDTLLQCRQRCEVYIQTLEQGLNQHAFLFGDKASLVDLALLPFIRQFARIERQWYLQSAYPKLRQWLNNYLQSAMFTKVMTKYPLWLENGETVFFAVN